MFSSTFSNPPSNQDVLGAACLIFCAPRVLFVANYLSLACVTRRNYFENKII